MTPAHFILFAGAFAIATVARAQPSSLYTLIDDCARQEVLQVAKDDGQDNIRQCTGPGGYTLTESYSAAGTVRSIAKPGSDFSVTLLPANQNCTIAAYGDKLEWRLADGAPVAVIQRIRCYGPYQDTEGNYDIKSNLLGHYLVVRGLFGRETPIDVDINVSEMENPNAAARITADGDH